MALSDYQLPQAQQENLLALLAHSDEHGRLISQTVTAEIFEGDYRVIAERCLDFWRKNEQAPKVHTADLFAEILEDKHDRKAPTIRRVLTSMYHLAEEEGINAKYVMDTLGRFQRMQHMKAAINQAAEIVNDARETSIEDAERVLQDILTARVYGFKPGIRLTDTKRILDYVREQSTEFTSGINALDASRIVPARGKLMVFISPSGVGKTWKCVNCGKHNLLRRKRVLHLVGEDDEEDLAERYWQALFSVPTDEGEDRITIPVLRKNADGKLVDIEFDDVEPDFSFESETIDDEMGERLKVFGEGFFNKLIIKRFPKSWGPNDLRGYLDALEATEGFVPDLMMVDSPYHMRTSIKEHRLHLGRNVEEIHEIGKERNMALVATHQVTREGMKSGNTRGTHLAEDISIFWTADNLLTFSATEFEQRMGLARIFVDKARKRKAKWEVLITQNYTIGQFCLASMRLPKVYYDIRKELADGDKKQDDIDDEDLGTFRDD